MRPVQFFQVVVAIACLFPSWLRPGPAAAADPDALWKIVGEQCLPNQQKTGRPAPCVHVDRHLQVAVLKDRNGIAQHLLIPTIRVSGIESPQLLDPDAPNYWAAAWAARRYVDAHLSRWLRRDEVALAINSASGRSQNQLHIHVDCIRPDVRDTLARDVGAIGERWAPLDEPLAGHPYWARRLHGAALGGNNPFKILADELPEAAQHMDRQTLVVTGATFEDGSKGFLLLADHAGAVPFDRASGEELLDHECAIIGQ